MKDFIEQAFNDLEGELNIRTKNDQAERNLYALADDLEAKDPEKYKLIIHRCRNRHYHDFGTTAATPKMDMHMDLLAVGLTDVDQRMQDGEFDS